MINYFHNLSNFLIRNGIIEENGQKFLVEYERVGFFDFNHNPLYEKFNMIKKELIK